MGEGGTTASSWLVMFDSNQENEKDDSSSSLICFEPRSINLEFAMFDFHDVQFDSMIKQEVVCCRRVWGGFNGLGLGELAEWFGFYFELALIFNFFILRKNDVFTFTRGLFGKSSFQDFLKRRSVFSLFFHYSIIHKIHKLHNVGFLWH